MAESSSREKIKARTAEGTWMRTPTWLIIKFCFALLPGNFVGRVEMSSLRPKVIFDIFRFLYTTLLGFDRVFLFEW